MGSYRKRFLARSLALLLSLTLMMPSAVMANFVDERPTASAMALDLVVARPLLGLATVLGAGGFVLSLPFSAIGGNINEVGTKMVVVPFKAAVIRCLGCTRQHLSGNAKGAGY